MSFRYEQFDFNSKAILENLPSEEYDLIKSRMAIRKILKGQSIFLEGSKPSYVYLLIKGKVKEFKTDTLGKEHIYNIATTKELFGYCTVISAEPYPHSATALTDIQIGILTAEDFQEIFRTSTTFSERVFKNIARQVGIMVHYNFIMRKPVQERLAFHLLVLREKYKEESNGNPVEIRISRLDLASLIGTAVETLVRELRELKDDKIIESSGQMIRIVNHKKLVKLTNFTET